MNVICVACVNTFLPDDSIYMTRCRHIFHRHCLFNWMEGTNTCPECYVICTASDVHRIYLSFANESSEQEALSSLNMDNEKMKKVHDELGATLSDLRIKVFNTLVDRKNLEFEILDLKVKYSQEKHQKMEGAKENYQQKKESVHKKYIEAKSLESVHKVLSGSAKDVEEELNSVKSHHQLAKMIILLQRKIKTAEDKRKAFRVVLQDSQEENVQLNSENRELLAKRDILRTTNYNLWDNFLNAQNELGVEQSNDRVPIKKD